jgi:hypothetical protein
LKQINEEIQIVASISRNGEGDESHNLLESIQEESGLNELDF